MSEAGRSEAAAEGRGADPALPPQRPDPVALLIFLFLFCLLRVFFFPPPLRPPFFFFFFFFFFSNPLPTVPSLSLFPPHPTRSPLPARAGHTLRSASCEPAARGRGGRAGGGTWCAAAAPPAPASSARAAGERPPGLRPRASAAPPGYSVS